MPLNPLLGYEFFEEDEMGRALGFDPVFGVESDQKFLAKLEDLAYDIHQLLELLETQLIPSAEEVVSDSEEDPGLASTEPGGKTIYLAETTLDLEEARNKIRREFTDKGHRVIPAESLPYTPDFADLVMAGLAESHMAIHLVSDQELCGGEGTDESVVDLQVKLSQARCREQMELSAERAKAEEHFSRIVWTPQKTENEWLKTLQRDPDFLAGGFEDLKTHIDTQLLRLAQPPKGMSVNDGQKKIYLDCDERDLDSPEIEPLYDYLETHFEVVTPEYEEGGIAVSEEMMRQCDGVLFYYGHGNGLWLKRRMRSLQKTLYKRVRPLLAQAVYVAAPETPPKKAFAAKEDVKLIVGWDAFSPELLEEFMQKLGVGA